MRRLSAQVFEMTTGARAWAPADGASSADDADEASSQTDSYRQGYLEGFDAGFADGDTEARRNLQISQEETLAAEKAARTAEEHWRVALVSMTKQFAKMQQEQQDQMEALAVTIAYAAVCRLVGRMHAEQELVAALCREVLASMHLEPVRLRVAQADRPSLEEAGLIMPIMADSKLEPGDCVIETPLGGIEAGIEVQLRALLQAFLETLGRKGHHS